MRLISLHRATCAAFLLLAALPARAQDPDDARLSAALRNRASVATSAPGASVPLEGVLDGRLYRIGPGDVFSVTVGGGATSQSLAPVSADGFVVLPGAGAVQVAGLSLDAARARIVEALRPLYRGADAALAAPRTFYVHVSGAIPAPGRRAVPPVARLEDALGLALAMPDSAPPYTRFGTGPALRSVRIEHRDGSVDTFDLLRYRRTGDLRHNPYLRDGDNVIVAAFDSLLSGIRVAGTVTFPGTYELREGDTALDLLTVADGPLLPADLRTLRVGTGEAIRVADLVAQPDAAPRLAPGSTIYVEGDRERATARVEGAVRIPGAHTIRQGRTTVRDLVALAGGLREDALARGAYLVRETRAGMPRATDVALRALQGAGDLPFVQRAALVDSSGGTIVSIPGEALTGGLALPVFEGDRLVVPRDENTVLIKGAVARPGYVPVRPGATAEAYLEAAGGLRREARSVLLVSAGTQGLRPAAGTTPLSGDVLVVTTDDPATRADLFGFTLQERSLGLTEQQFGLAERQFGLAERQLLFQQQQERRNRRFQTFTTVLSVFSTVAGIFTTYLLITREQQPATTAAGN